MLSKHCTRVQYRELAAGVHFKEDFFLYNKPFGHGRQKKLQAENEVFLNVEILLSFFEQT